MTINVYNEHNYTKMTSLIDQNNNTVPVKVIIKNLDECVHVYFEWVCKCECISFCLPSPGYRPVPFVQWE